MGFLPGTDERVTGTIDAVSRELGRDGFVSRYSTAETDDGLAGDEGQFLACSFWLVSALAMNGRVDEARSLFERLVGLANDLGLLAEEYDVGRRRQVGNFPQAFSHLTLILAARAIAAAEANSESTAGTTSADAYHAFRHDDGSSGGPGTVGHASLTRSIPRWRKEAVARGPVRYFRKAATIGRTERRRRSVTNEIG